MVGKGSSSTENQTMGKHQNVPNVLWKAWFVQINHVLTDG